MKIEDYTHAELVEKLERIYNQPYLRDTIEGLIDKIEEINEAFRNTTIDVTSDIDKSFGNLIIWAEKSVKITDNINSLLERIDPEIKSEIREKMRTASDVSLEGMIKKAKSNA